MSDQPADAVSGDHSNAAADASKVSAAADSTPKIESPGIAPQAVPAGEPVAPAIEAAKAETPRAPGKIMIMAPSRNDDWRHDNAGTSGSAAADSGDAGVLGKRRFSAFAAVIALATVAGAIGGSLATTGIGRFKVADQTQPVAAAPSHALEASIQRLDSEMASLKSSVEHSSRQSAVQNNKTNDRIDKVEKAKVEPAAKLAKLTETIDKLRIAAATPAPAQPAPAPAAPKETTASIPAAAPVPVPAPKPEIARLPIVETWSLRDVADGAALIQGRQGVYEVYAGDFIPGLGRVDAIRRQDGRWTVVTSKGLIVAR